MCDVGDLAPGESFSAVLTIAVPPSAASGTLTNVATASSPTPDPNPGRRTATADVRVQLVADVSVVKTLLTDPVVPGQPVTYRIDVANAGPSDAINGTFVDPLPPGTALAGGSPPPGATCRVDTTEVTHAIVCTMARLAAGESVSGTITLATDPGLTGTLTNTGPSAPRRSTSRTSTTPPRPRPRSAARSPTCR